MATLKTFPTIKSIRTFIIEGAGSGGDYHNVAGGHWFTATPDPSNSGAEMLTGGAQAD